MKRAQTTDIQTLDAFPSIQKTMNNRTQQTDTPTPRDACSLAVAYAEEVPHPPELQRREIRATADEEEDASSDEEMRREAVAVAGSGVFTGPTSPSVLSEPQAPPAFDEQCLAIAELAEVSQEEEELRRRNQELEQEDEEHRRRNQELELIVNGAVTATVIVETSGGDDHDVIATPSPFGRKERRFLIGAALALLLVVGVILGVTIPLTTNNNNNKDSPSIDSVVTPTQSQSPSQSPAPTACTSLDCLTEILLQNEVSDAEALQDDSSPQFLALRWLANNDTMVLDQDSTRPVILVERYVLALLYFATSAEGVLDGLNFLSASSVCDWNNEEGGVICNGDDSVVALLLGKSKHKEVINLASKIRVNVMLLLTFPCDSI
jgi:hypothetical protein